MNPKNIILIVVDALAKNVLSLYNEKGVTTPYINEYFKNAAIYHNAYCQSEWTTTSFANMFTGQYSSHHRSNHRLDKYKHSLPKGTSTLAEVFQENGYYTYFHSGTNRISNTCGYDRGFNRMICDDYKKLNNSDITYKAIDVLNKYKDDNKFMVLHYMDVHAPPVFWSSLRDHDSEFREISVKNTFRKTLDEWERVYRNQVKELDLGLGILFSFLERSNFKNNTAVILTSDHGQLDNNCPINELEPLLVERMTKVPLMVRCPWRGKLKGNIKGIVEAGVDLYPSLLELAEIDHLVHYYSQSFVSKHFKGKQYAITESIYEGNVQRIIHSKEHIYYSKFNWKTGKESEKLLLINNLGTPCNDSKEIVNFKAWVKNLQLVNKNDNPDIYYGKY